MNKRPTDFQRSFLEEDEEEDKKVKSLFLITFALEHAKHDFMHFLSFSAQQLHAIRQLNFFQQFQLSPFVGGA